MNYKYKIRCNDCKEVFISSEISKTKALQLQRQHVNKIMKEQHILHNPFLVPMEKNQ